MSAPVRFLARLGAARASFAGDERGATAIEYALIAGAIFLAIVSSVASIGPKLSNVFAQVGSNLK